VVDDQLDRHERLHARRVAAELGHRVAHGGQVGDGGDAGEVLHEHAGGREGDLDARLGRRVPAGQREHLLGTRGSLALGAEHVLEQDLQREGQAIDVVLVGH